MQYKWKVPAVEKEIAAMVDDRGVPANEIGSFEVFTEEPNKLKKGSGTIFIYIQGVNMKYGSDDLIGNSPISWIEESLFPSVGESENRKMRLPIGHVARRINFDHFFSFVFPEVLSARGFKKVMDGLMSFLADKHFVTVLVGFSNGAILSSEWLLNCILEKDEKSLSLLGKLFNLVICAGAPCQTSDYESKARMVARISVSRALRIIYPVAGLHPFVQKGGGVKELVSRGKYLLNLDNLTKASMVKEENWNRAKQLLSQNSDFRVIFLADLGQRLVLPSGPINWYSIFAPKLGTMVRGFITKEVKSVWFKIPDPDHSEIKQLWTIISLVGQSMVLRKKLGFSPVANEIANNWPLRRYDKMVLS